MRTHSPIGFSGAKRWLTCPGSVALGKGIVGVSSEYAEEGTAAHALAEECLKNGYMADRFKGWTIDIAPVPVAFNGPELVAFYAPGSAFEVGPRQFDVTPEMVEGVNLFLRTVRDDFTPGDDLAFETPISLPQLHPDLWGTADARNWSPKRRLLRVYDFKYGAGIQVEVAENEQVIGYALGVAMQIGRGIDQVELVIVQPRAPHVDGPVRRWTMDAIDLLDWAEVFKRGAERCDEPDAPLVPGDHCRWCKAAGICPKVAEVAQIAVTDTYSGPRYDPEMLADSLERAAIVEKWAKAVREFALNEANQGRVPPRFKLVEKRAVRTYTDEAEAIRMLLGDGMDESDIIDPPKLKSPATIEEMIGKKRFSDLVGEYVASTSSGLTLAPITDNRPAVKRDVIGNFEPVAVLPAPSVSITETDDPFG